VVDAARDMEGTRFLYALASCPPSWKLQSGLSIKVMRKAADSRVFPLYEVRDGTDVTVPHWPDGAVDATDYFEMPGRFRPLLGDPDTLEKARASIDRRWQGLVARHHAAHPREETAG
jgi:pyruvate/2-oxoacid:ferredoxin oxidoreductase beta subunit